LRKINITGIKLHHLNYFQNCHLKRKKEKKKKKKKRKILKNPIKVALLPPGWVFGA
jgi:hypothetical protein